MWSPRPLQSRPRSHDAHLLRLSTEMLVSCQRQQDTWSLIQLQFKQNCGPLYYGHHVAGVLGSIPLICRRSTQRRPRECEKPLSATLGARRCLAYTIATLRSRGLPSCTPTQVLMFVPQHLMKQLKSVKSGSTASTVVHFSVDFCVYQTSDDTSLLSHPVLVSLHVTFRISYSKTWITVEGTVM